MKKKRRIVLSLILVLAMCCQLPVAAGELSRTDTAPVDLSGYREVIEHRTANSKHFQLPDGTFTAVAYPPSGTTEEAKP